MTSWTTPTTWSSGNTPTAANFNTQIRDNLLHLKEQTDAIGYAYSYDPRVINTSYFFGAGANTAYIRGWGHCLTTRAIRMRVTATAGMLDVGFYSNAQTGMGVSPAAAAIPFALKDNSGEVACPAIGTADVLLSTGLAEFDPGDWFALGLNTGGGTEAIAAAGDNTLAGGRGWYTTAGHQLGTQGDPVIPEAVFFLLVAIT